MSMSIQREMILSHLRDIGGITAKEAAERYGCERLSARILEIKRNRHDIKGEMVSRVNRLGHPTRYKRYWLAGGAG